MLILLHIALAIWAWRRGWGAWGFLPVVIAQAVNFLFGFLMALSYGFEESIVAMSAVAIVSEIAVYTALGIMIARPPKPVAPKEAIRKAAI